MWICGHAIYERFNWGPGDEAARQGIFFTFLNSMNITFQLVEEWHRFICVPVGLQESQVLYRGGPWHRSLWDAWLYPIHHVVVGDSSLATGTYIAIWKTPLFWLHVFGL